jgi:hypothetical protein
MRKACGNVLDNLKGDCYQVRMTVLSIALFLSRDGTFVICPLLLKGLNRSVWSFMLLQGVTVTVFPGVGGGLCSGSEKVCGGREDV